MRQLTSFGQLAEPCVHAHERAAVQVRIMRQGFQSDVEFSLSQGESSRTRRQDAVFVRSLREGVPAQIRTALARGVQARY